MHNQAIIILGMHRSGTSATTGMLKCLGVTLGKKLYRGHAHINAKGYFEHSHIADTNEEALLAINSAWDDFLPKPKNWWKDKTLAHYAKKIKHYIRKDFSQSAVWAIKDPRVCRLIPWWLEILSEESIDAKYLIVVRPPHEVYLSLKRRDNFSLEKAYLLWLLHYLDAEYWTRDKPRTFVTFEALINDPVTTFTYITEELDIKFPVPLSEAIDDLSQFISKDLIHHQNQPNEPYGNSKLIELANNLYNELVRPVADNKQAVDFNNIDTIQQQTDEFQQGFPALLVEHLQATQKIRCDLQLTMNKIFRSYSQPLGKPIRFIERKLGMDV